MGYGQFERAESYDVMMKLQKYAKRVFDIDEHHADPLAVLAELMLNPSQEPKIRLDAAKVMMPYCYVPAALKQQKDVTPTIQVLGQVDDNAVYRSPDRALSNEEGYDDDDDQEDCDADNEDIVITEEEIREMQALLKEHEDKQREEAVREHERLLKKRGT